MKKSCHVFNYYKNKELVRDVVPERRIVMVVHQGEAPKWCVRIILVHGAIINQILAVKQPFFNVFASILITNSNFHDALTVQAGPRGRKRGADNASATGCLCCRAGCTGWRPRVFCLVRSGRRGKNARPLTPCGAPRGSPLRILAIAFALAVPERFTRALHRIVDGGINLILYGAVRRPAAGHHYLLTREPYR